MKAFRSELSIKLEVDIFAVIMLCKSNFEIKFSKNQITVVSFAACLMVDCLMDMWVIFGDDIIKRFSRETVTFEVIK